MFAGAHVKGIVIKPEDDLNLGVYGKTADELLKEPVDGGATTESDLNTFPRALSRHTTQS